MLILSKKNEKDYYDGVVGTTGIDKTIVYHRKIIEIDGKHTNGEIPKIFNQKNFKLFDWDNPFYLITRIHAKQNNKKYFDVVPFFIGFCGKLYVGWKLYYKVKKYPWDEIKTDFEYDIENVIDYLNLNDDNTKISRYRESVKKIQNINVVDIFREYNTPCFIYDPDYDRTSIDWKYYQMFLVNPLLKEYKFFKVFDAFQTLQEIQMFISGVLGTNEKEIVTVEDKYKIQQHGFDKWSFRRKSKK